jgi:hypothetical protein
MKGRVTKRFVDGEYERSLRDRKYISLRGKKYYWGFGVSERVRGEIGKFVIGRLWMRTESAARLPSWHRRGGAKRRGGRSSALKIFPYYFKGLAIQLDRPRAASFLQAWRVAEYFAVEIQGIT